VRDCAVYLHYYLEVGEARPFDHQEQLAGSGERLHPKRQRRKVQKGRRRDLLPVQKVVWCARESRVEQFEPKGVADPHRQPTVEMVGRA